MSTVQVTQKLRQYVGLVLDNSKMAKTIRVRVKKPKWDPKHQVTIQLTKDYLVHDPKERANLGDVVKIEALGKYISARKSFGLKDILSRNTRVEHQFSKNEALNVIKEEKNILDKLINKDKQKSIYWDELRFVTRHVHKFGASRLSPKKLEEREKLCEEIRKKNNWPSPLPSKELIASQLSENIKDIETALNQVFVRSDENDKYISSLGLDPYSITSSAYKNIILKKSEKDQKDYRNLSVEQLKEKSIYRAQLKEQRAKKAKEIALKTVIKTKNTKISTKSKLSAKSKFDKKKN